MKTLNNSLVRVDHTRIGLSQIRSDPHK